MLPKKFCPACGKETEIFINGFCIECFKKRFKKTQFPKFIKIYQCKFCKKFAVGNLLFDSLEEAVNKAIKDFKDLKLILIAENFVKLAKEVENLIIEEKDVEIKIKQIICKYCNMMQTGYKQAIIQLRSKNNEEFLKIIEEVIEKERKFDNLSFISKIEESKNGIDLYIGSKKAAYKAINEIKKYYKINIKVSKKLVGIKSGKRIFLDTIAIR